MADVPFVNSQCVMRNSQLLSRYVFVGAIHESPVKIYYLLFIQYSLLSEYVIQTLRSDGTSGRRPLHNNNFLKIKQQGRPYVVAR